eukprot:134317-Chlamydomonas_euryale.AAC.1
MKTWFRIFFTISFRTALSGSARRRNSAAKRSSGGMRRRRWRAARPAASCGHVRMRTSRGAAAAAPSAAVWRGRRIASGVLRQHRLQLLKLPHDHLGRLRIQHGR